jgi:hypothetical protein
VKASPNTFGKSNGQTRGLHRAGIC